MTETETVADTTTANSSSSNSKENEMDELLKIEVPCETKEGEKIPVRAALLHQSKTFETMWKDLNLSSSDQLKEFVFPVKAVSAEIFNKVVDWLKEHVGKPIPVVEEDAGTRERKWFTFTDWETAFFKVDVVELADLLVAGNFLDIPSLYLYGCQSMAALIKDKTPEEIRETFGLEDNMTEAEKTEVRRKNVWCNY